MDPKWTVVLTAAAQSDYAGILTWTLDSFGENQVHFYDETLLLALDDLVIGPRLLGVKKHDDIGADICTLHIARKGRKGRHFLMFRVNQDKYTLEVLRILHDSMDLQRHLPADDLH